MSALDEALRALNEAAYVAASEAKRSGDPRANVLLRLALQSDDIMDGAAVLTRAKVA